MDLLNTYKKIWRQKTLAFHLHILFMYAWQLLLSHNLHNIALGILYDVDALLH